MERGERGGLGYDFSYRPFGVARIDLRYCKGNGKSDISFGIQDPLAI